MESHLETIQRAFNAPDVCLGTVERNTEIKIVFLMLWELGWDPIQEIASCFQIQRKKFPNAKAALAADFALRDEIGICAVGEVKHWKIGARGWGDGVEQARHYRAALEAPRAFISCGWRWTLLDDNGNIEHEFEEKTDAESLLKKLRPHLGKGTIKNPARDSSVWDYGMCPNPASRRKK